MSGWIKLHRSITEHWLYTEKRTFSRFEAWNDILLTVNYADAQCCIKGKIYNIKRGESILSLDSWGKRWAWDKSKVRRFLNTLQKENMIVIKADTITTQLIVCKYDDYQGFENADEPKKKRKRNTDENQTTPIKEEEEEEEEKEIKFDFKKSLINYGFNENLVTDWLIVRKNKKAANTETAFKNFILELEKRGCDKNEILETIITKSWTGFKWNWMDNIQISQTGNNQSLAHQPQKQRYKVHG
jgi:hypothetical protein